MTDAEKIEAEEKEKAAEEARIQAELDAEQADKDAAAATKEAADKFVYIVHPVSPALKKAVLAEGKKILDAKFAPKGAKVVNPHKQKEPEGKNAKGAGSKKSGGNS